MSNTNNYNINLSGPTLYSRYDPSGTAAGGLGTTISYYGYAKQGSADGDTTFSIKKVYYIGAVQYTDWSNNEIGNQEASWANRAYYFATPSNISTITATVSFFKTSCALLRGNSSLVTTFSSVPPKFNCAIACLI